MNNLSIKMPNIWYKGDERYPPQTASKICIDWSKNKIRMSLQLYPSHNHPNIKKEIQYSVEWLSMDSSLLEWRD